MKISKLKSILLSLMAFAMLTVFLTSCEKEEIVAEEQQIENTQNFSSEGMMLRSDCDKWLVPKNEHKLSSQKSLTLTTQTQAFKAPENCAKRGFKYKTGTVVKASHKIGNFYWITAPGYFSGADDTGWIVIPNSSTTGSTNTNTTTNTNFDCSKWLVPKDEHKLSSQKSLTLTIQTQAYKAPGTCAPRGFKYSIGTVVKASHKINNFYWITAPGYFSGTDDNGWIDIPNTSTTGGSNTNTTSTNTNNTTGFEPKPENNPFICDGTSKTVGHFTGFMPGETVKVSYAGKSSKKVADSNGKRSITWSCNYFSDLDLVAYGQTSGRTFTYSFKTGSSGSTGGTSGGTSTGSNTNNSNGATGNTNTGTNTNNSNSSSCTGEREYAVTPYDATIKDEGTNAPFLVYKSPKTPYSCAESFSTIEQGSKVRITKEARGYVYIDNKKGWVRESTIIINNNYCGAFRVDPKGDAGINPRMYIEVGNCDDKQRIVIPNLKLKRGVNCSEDHEIVVFDLDLTFHVAQNKVVIDQVIIDVKQGVPGLYMTLGGLQGFLKEHSHNRYYVYWDVLGSSNDLSKFVWSTNFNEKNQAGLSLGLRWSFECSGGFVAVFEK